MERIVHSLTFKYLAASAIRGLIRTNSFYYIIPDYISLMSTNKAVVELSNIFALSMHPYAFYRSDPKGVFSIIILICFYFNYCCYDTKYTIYMKTRIKLE